MQGEAIKVQNIYSPWRILVDHTLGWRERNSGELILGNNLGLLVGGILGALNHNIVGPPIGQDGDVPGSSDGEIDASHIGWMDKTLEDAANEPIL